MKKFTLLTVLFTMYSFGSLLAQQVQQDYSASSIWVEQTSNCVNNGTSTVAAVNNVSSTNTAKFSSIFAFSEFDQNTAGRVFNTQLFQSFGYDIDVKQIKATTTQNGYYIGGTLVSTSGLNSNVPFLMRIDLSGAIVGSYMSAPDAVGHNFVDFDLYLDPFTGQTNVVVLSEKSRMLVLTTFDNAGTFISSVESRYNIPMTPRAMTIIRAAGAAQSNWPCVAVTGTAFAWDRDNAFVSTFDYGMNNLTTTIIPDPYDGNDGFDICSSGGYSGLGSGGLSTTDFLAITGKVRRGNENSILVSRLDFDGNIICNDIINDANNGKNNIYGRAIILDPTQPGGLLIAGPDFNHDPSGATNDIRNQRNTFLLNMADCNNIAWFKEYTDSDAYDTTDKAPETIEIKGNKIWVGTNFDDDFYTGSGDHFTYQLVTRLDGDTDCQFENINPNSFPYGKAFLEPVMTPNLSLDWNNAPISFASNLAPMNNDICGSNTQWKVQAPNTHNTKNNATISAVYPNPTSGEFNITTEFGNIKAVALMDISGKMIFKKEYADGQFSLNYDSENLDNGAYFLEIQKLDGSLERSKLIIQK
jgi:hypothetical protein